MGEVKGRRDIDIELGKLHSEKIEERSAGIIKLTQIIKEKRKNLKQINDTGYHTILETVFRVAKLESSNLVRATKYTKPKIESRLLGCGTLVRVIVEVGLRKLRYKTVKALIEHISQTLPTADAGYCAPLCKDYFKALANLLEYKAHPEHFLGNEWHEIVDFCIEAARDLRKSNDVGEFGFADRTRGAHVSTSRRDYPSRSTTPSTVGDHGRSSSSNASQSATYTAVRDSQVEIANCLHHLVSVSNAPICDRANVIVTCIIELLDSYPKIAAIQQLLFDCINSIISRIIADDIGLCMQLIHKILPLLRRFWDVKDNAAREPILVLLSHVEVFLPRLTSQDSTEDTRAALSALVEFLRGDYCTRRPREQLQLDDLTPIDRTRGALTQMPLCSCTLQVRAGSIKAEQPWCLIYSSAAIMVALEHETMMNERSIKNVLEFPPKRQRLTHPLDDLFTILKESDFSEKVYALQMLVFVFDTLVIDEAPLKERLDVLLPYLSDDNGLIISWASFAMTAAAGMCTARSLNLNGFWLKVWRLVARHVTSLSTCRAACHLMTELLVTSLVQYIDVADLVDGMIRSADLNGPAGCDESATNLWTVLLTFRSRENLSSAPESSENVLRWLCIRWSPANVHDRQQAIFKAQFSSTFSIVRLICICLGLLPPSAWPPSIMNLGSLSQTRLMILRNQNLMNYLLLNEVKSRTLHVDTNLVITGIAGIKLSYPKRHALIGKLIDFFVSEGSTLQQAYFSEATEPNNIINADAIRTTISFSITGYSLLSSSSFKDIRESCQLVKILQNLSLGLRRCIIQHNERQELAGYVLESFGAVLVPIERVGSKADLLTNGVLAMSQGFDQEFWNETLRWRDATDTDLEEDEMSLYDGFDSQWSKVTEETLVMDNSHLEIPTFTNAVAYRSCTAAKVCFMVKAQETGDTRTSTAQAATSMIEYLTSLHDQEFLACRNLISELLNSDISIAEVDVSRLLEYLAAVFLRSYQWERAEVSMGVILEVMTSLAEVWTFDETSDVFSMGEEIYSWFTNTALRKGLSSPYVHVCISAMLQRIVKFRPEYGANVHLHSPRTTLFEVLHDGNIAVKFHIGNNIADIFGLFILSEHGKILEDVRNSLPKDPTWNEGFALRIYILSHLAASWSTLLRHCLYWILECPNYNPSSAKYASNRLKHITASLDLRNPMSLLKLFVPQIVYTWLEQESLMDFPYHVFGYNTLLDLLHDVQDEIVGQVVMRGKDDEANQLAKNLGLPFESLLEISFSKVLSYCIARDVAMPSSKTTQVPRAEPRVRSAVGKERYSSLVANNFPAALATFVNTMDPDREIERGFQNYPAYVNARTAYTEMVSRADLRALPIGQQPLFKARFLFGEIEYLCRRASYDPKEIWTPELYVFILRETLDTIHPALGPLHACTVLRRIRMLISMAGSTALEQYPLEMALQSLQPYLTSTQCAEEAMGIVRYLLEHGASYLREVPSFLAGHAVSTLTSMKAFFDATQDTTTQESQFRATMSNAQAFHAWFSTYLGNYSSPQLSEDSATCFKTIINAASHIQRGGNARHGTYESELLVELLQDQRSGRNLLDQSCRDTILKFLCTPFEVPSDFRDDVLGSDEHAALYAPIIWETCQHEVASSSYLVWAGRVLGRAYAGKGLIDREMINEMSSGPRCQSLSVYTTTESSSSRTSLLRLLCDVLHDDRSSQVGTAEATLRSIVTKADGTEDFLDYTQCIPPSLIKSLLWRRYELPVSGKPLHGESKLHESTALTRNMPAEEWIQKLCIALVLTTANDPILAELVSILQSISGLAEKAFPYILHLVLLKEIGGQQNTKRIISNKYKQLFQDFTGNEDTVVSSTRILLQAILFLRTQPLPNEVTKADRAKWLEIDYKQAAAAAIKCSMFKTALLFLEIDYSEAAKLSRRSSAIKSEEPSDLLLEIYEKIDEQDAFYGVQQPSSLSSMMSRLEYEHAGFKSLSFRAAHYDGQIRLSSGEHQADEERMVRALDNLDLNGLSQSLLTKMRNTGPIATDSVLRSARKLEQWDISAPAAHISCSSLIFKVFQCINSAADITALATSLDTGFSDAMTQLMLGRRAKSAMHQILGTLAVLTEADEVFSCRKSEQLFEVLERFEDRASWMHSESYEHFKNILSCRETCFSVLSKKSNLQDILKITLQDARSVESRSLLASSQMSRLHGALQSSLSTTTYLTQLVVPCENAGIDIAAAVQFESAKVLWAQGEMTASIKILQELKNSLGLHTQLVQLGKSELLATLGHQISEARLEKPDEIINKYLIPAINQLGGVVEGDEAGQVFHEFASFCDQQLQNPDSLEDFHRIRKLRTRKQAEVEDLSRMMKSGNSQARDRANLKSYRDKAKLWFDLDDREFQRLQDSRQTFLRQSLENYLQCLKACDKYDNDALRFSALWLENHDSDIANEAVSKHVGHVGSRKFAPLMNQWSSRLLESPEQFQILLALLVLRICVDHPYHGMYQVFAGSKSKGGKDDKALSRNAAANNVVGQLKSNKRSASTWMAVHNTNICFVRFASERLEDPSIKPGSRVPLRKSTNGQRVEQDVQKQPIPPPTAKIELRADCDYSNVPLIARFQSDFSVASGISMPKILTAIGTDGLKYKQLFKSGNDDLRQDSIMEQVFEQVSSLLRTQRATRQRNLSIRTYKVLPLTATTGIIEFVPNTIPLHDYLLPAHQRHFPNDLKPSNCRKHIADAQGKSVEQRIKTFRSVCEKFHPVLRYFLMERFDNPDDWFEKRLAYTRSTAAISILGHVLGLGDRHGHNILLDEKTGEVIHIDLGIAFEQGRILTVPEVVPFRLTRDLVDGMGITKTEGVFRRCCEFTLEALRNESYSIMTILDVLRYDPLYSWSLSPLRLKKMQDAQTEDPKLPGAGGDNPGREEGEPGEADRALTVVKKKLSRSLSVQATVNELIQMATDERNLAVLFCGWAAYA